MTRKEYDKMRRFLTRRPGKVGGYILITMIVFNALLIPVNLFYGKWLMAISEALWVFVFVCLLRNHKALEQKRKSQAEWFKLHEDFIKSQIEER